MPARSHLDNATAAHSNDAINDSMSEVMSVAMTDDRESTVGTVTPSIPNPEVEHVREVLATMKQTLASLGVCSCLIFVTKYRTIFVDEL